jgi:hypothetical protein
MWTVRDRLMSLGFSYHVHDLLCIVCAVGTGARCAPASAAQLGVVYNTHAARGMPGCSSYQMAIASDTLSLCVLRMGWRSLAAMAGRA